MTEFDGKPISNLTTSHMRRAKTETAIKYKRDGQETTTRHFAFEGSSK